jgi:hypothetical protein
MPCTLALASLGFSDNAPDLLLDIRGQRSGPAEGRRIVWTRHWNTRLCDEENGSSAVKNSMMQKTVGEVATLEIVKYREGKYQCAPATPNRSARHYRSAESVDFVEFWFVGLLVARAQGTDAEPSQAT